MLTPDQTAPLLSIALFAAFADGGKSDAERGRIRDVVQALATEAGEPNLSEALRRVLFKETTLAAEAAKLNTPELRAMAWEAALSVCESDASTTPAERVFLNDLAAALGRDTAQAAREVEQADEIVNLAAEPSSTALTTAVAAIPLGAAASNLPSNIPVVRSPGTASTTPPPLATEPANSDPLAFDQKTQAADKLILRYSILTAAIELLPQGLASVAIIPLQTKLVHAVAAIYGFPLSAAMIKEFIATVGIGATGQAVENYARKFLGKLAKQYLGSGVGGMAKTAINWGTGPAMTFATTYAIGQVARQYYAGGRTLSAINLRTLFSSQVDKAKSLYTQYEPQVMQTAKGTSASQIMSMLRG